MPDNEIISIANGPETAKEKFERERLTRRQALKKFGMTAGMAVFALFSMDDLTHMVGKALEQRAGDSKVASQIAEEFQKAGVAFATGTSGSTCSGNYDCTGCGGTAATGDCCAKSTDKTSCCQKSYGPSTGSGNTTSCKQCCAHATSDGTTERQSCNDMCNY